MLHRAPGLDLDTLLARGGFPELLFAKSERGHRRWQNERADRFFREDVRELENIRDLSSMELLADMLPARVGSMLSVNALREDLEVSHKAVTHWLDVLDRLYFTFRVPPYAARSVRAIHESQKAYLWDWSLVDSPGPRFENLVASHLLKLCHHLADVVRDESPAPHLRYFGDRLKIPHLYQAVLGGRRDTVRDGVRVVPADRLLAAIA